MRSVMFNIGHLRISTQKCRTCEKNDSERWNILCFFLISWVRDFRLALKITWYRVIRCCIQSIVTRDWRQLYKDTRTDRQSEGRPAGSAGCLDAVLSRNGSFTSFWSVAERRLRAVRHAELVSYRLAAWINLGRRPVSLSYLPLPTDTFYHQHSETVQGWKGTYILGHKRGCDRSVSMPYVHPSMTDGTRRDGTGYSVDRCMRLLSPASCGWTGDADRCCVPSRTNGQGRLHRINLGQNALSHK